MTPGILDRVVRTEPLVSAGKSGSALERGWLDDGTRVVIKRADAEQDWIMQATSDTGRIAALWEAGVFRRLPTEIDHTIIDVVARPGGPIVVMRDATEQLFATSAPSRDAQGTVLRAAAALHVTLADARPADLCELADYYAFLSPAVCTRFAADHEVPRLAIEGWARFEEIVDGDVAAAIRSVHADPNRLATALLELPSTVVHGDLKFANLGTGPAGAVVLDWGTLTTWAPPAVDYAWYLAINAAATGREHDDLLAEIRGVQGSSYDPTAQCLALVGALAQLGWDKALGATSDDAAVAARERAGLAWWSSRVREAVQLGAPFA